MNSTMRTLSVTLFLVISMVGTAQKNVPVLQPLELVVTFKLEKPDGEWLLIDTRVKPSYAPRSPLLDGDLVFNATDPQGTTLSSTMLNDPCVLVVCEDEATYQETVVKPCRAFVSMRYVQDIRTLSIVQHSTGARLQDLDVGTALKEAYDRLLTNK